MNIIHRPVFHLKHFSEIGFCLSLQVKSIQLGASPEVSGDKG
jgi:hypothetical protein